MNESRGFFCSENFLLCCFSFTFRSIFDSEAAVVGTVGLCSIFVFHAEPSSKIDVPNSKPGLIFVDVMVLCLWHLRGLVGS